MTSPCGYAGTIAYVGDEVGERGRERFRVTVAADGARTIRASCEIDDAGILRDVVHTVDRDWRPVEAWVRLAVDGHTRGSAWYRFDGHEGSCDADLVDQGHVAQRLTLERPITSFNPHAVATDMWHVGACDRRATGRQPLSVVTASPLANGGSGPALATVGLAIECLGRERVTVRAGTFDCEHFRFHYDHDWPSHDAWATPDDLVLVRMRWDMLATTYELTDLA